MSLAISTKHRILAAAVAVVMALSVGGEALADPGRGHGRDRDWDHDRGRDWNHHDKYWNEHRRDQHRDYWDGKRRGRDDRDVFLNFNFLDSYPRQYYPRRPYYAPAPRYHRGVYNDSGMGVVGGVAGALVGSQVGRGGGRVAAIVGGAILGSMLGTSLTPVDYGYFHQSFEGYTDGTPMAWNGNGGNYEVVPVRTFATNSGYCREFQARSMIGGRMQETYGTACRQPDGAWEIQN